MKRCLFILISLIIFVATTTAGNIAQTKQTPVIIHNPATEQTSIKKQFIDTIVITNPKRKDVVTPHATMTIKWKFTAKNGTKRCVSVELYEKAKKIATLSPRVCKKQYKWKIPSNVKDGQYRIKLTTLKKRITAFSHIFYIAKPDLYIGKNDIRITPVHPKEGDNVKIYITVRNGGKIKAVDSVAKITIFGPGEKKPIYNKMLSVGFIPPKGKTLITIPINTSTLYGNMMYGKYVVEIQLDANNKITESNEKNNHKRYVFSTQGSPHLFVCIDTGKRPRPGKYITIRVYIVNLGSATSEPSYVYLNTRTLSNKEKTYRFLVPPVPAHSVDSSISIQYRWSVKDLLYKKKTFEAYFSGSSTAEGVYILTRHGGKKGQKNKIKCNFGVAVTHAVDRNNYFKILKLHYKH